jgi:hypothetical protein
VCNPWSYVYGNKNELIGLCKMFFCIERGPYRFGSGFYLNWIVSSSSKSRGNICIRVVIVSWGGWCLMGADLPTTPRGKVLCIMLASSSLLTTYSYLGSDSIGWVLTKGVPRYASRPGLGFTSSVIQQWNWDLNTSYTETEALINICYLEYC